MAEIKTWETIPVVEGSIAYLRPSQIFSFGGGTNVDVMSTQFLLVMYICAYDTVV